MIFEGRKALLRHVRDGVELPEIVRDDHYDFNFQVSFTKKKKKKELKWNETNENRRGGRLGGGGGTEVGIVIF